MAESVSSLDDLNPKNLKPANNQITVLKTLLVYMNLLSGEKDEIEHLSKALRLLYPAKVPATSADKAKALGICATCPSKEGGLETSLMVPNAGFIFGGQLIDDVCRGIDCSAFISYCSDSSVKLSTMVMEFAWRELKQGNGTFSEKEKPVREEFLSKWGMKVALEEYEALSPGEKDAPLPGDIVVWRWPVGGETRSGHAVVFLSSQGDGNFLGVEANREDDKSKEGIAIDRFKLLRENSDTYILRKKRR